MVLGGLGRFLIITGLVIVAMGGLLLWLDRGLPSGLNWLGRLPGDIYLQRKNFTFFFPVTTSLIISLILSMVLWFFIRR
jgi:uncharacterized protein HemY